MNNLNLTGTLPIETPRLLLRRFSAGDADDMFANWANDPVVTRFLLWDAHADISVTRAILAQWEAAYADPRTYHWAIVLKETGEPIGTISLMHFDEQNQKAAAGYCIGRRWWGMGIMTEALRAVLGFAFETVGLNRVEANHDVQNPASGDVMRKAGMQYEGHFRQWKFHKGKFCDYEFYGILRDDYFK